MLPVVKKLIRSMLKLMDWKVGVSRNVIRIGKGVGISVSTNATLEFYVLLKSALLRLEGIANVAITLRA